MIYTIALRELKTLFLSPLAWSILAILQLLLGYLFLTQLENFIAIQARLATLDNAAGMTDVIVLPLYTNAANILLLITPLLTMRLICEERRQKTLSLLLSSPVSLTEIILGKYFAVLGLLILMIGLISLMPLSLLIGGELDFGKFLANIFALILLVASFSALGVYMSCLSSHSSIAAVASFGLLFLLWILGNGAPMDSDVSPLFAYVSMLPHFQNLQSSLINSADVAYFIVFSLSFLILSIRHLEKERLAV